MLLAAVQIAAQETMKVTEIAIVEDSAPDNVKINGKMCQFINCNHLMSNRNIREV